MHIAGRTHNLRGQGASSGTSSAEIWGTGPPAAHHPNAQTFERSIQNTYARCEQVCLVCAGGACRYAQGGGGWSQVGSEGRRATTRAAASALNMPLITMKFHVSSSGGGYMIGGMPAIPEMSGDSIKKMQMEALRKNAISS
jgi:hypothetical protein